MNAAVRYYSRSGNTKMLADAIAGDLHVQAVPVDSPDAEIKEKTDVLFVGGALYAYGLDKHMKKFLASVDPDKVSKAAIFSTSWISRHSIDLIRQALEAKGIQVAAESFYVKNKPNAEELKEAEAYAERMVH